VIADAKFESSATFFEGKYLKDPDPWDFSSSSYELERYDAIIRAISTRRYHRAFEPGCSIGVLTERLAAHCDAVDAIDFSPTAAAQASAHCAHLPNVHIYCAAMPDRMPADDCDVLVLSEIGYYFTSKAWREITAQLIDSIPQGAVVLAAHWLGYSPDHCISGEEVHQILLACTTLQLQHAERNPGYRLDRLVRL
jgi:SAM-dependent methyltransferase